MPSFGVMAPIFGAGAFQAQLLRHSVRFCVTTSEQSRWWQPRSQSEDEADTDVDDGYETDDIELLAIPPLSLAPLPARASACRHRTAHTMSLMVVNKAETVVSGRHALLRTLEAVPSSTHMAATTVADTAPIGGENPSLGFFRGRAGNVNVVEHASEYVGDNLLRYNSLAMALICAITNNDLDLVNLNMVHPMYIVATETRKAVVEWLAKIMCGTVSVPAVKPCSSPTDRSSIRQKLMERVGNSPIVIVAARAHVNGSVTAIRPDQESLCLLPHSSRRCP